MRTTLSLSVALLIVSATNIFAQDSDILSRTIFKLSPQHFIHNSLKAGIERFNKNHTGSIAVFITGRLENNGDFPYDLNRYDGLAGELQFRKYMRPMKLHTSKRNNVFQQGIYGAAYLQGGGYSGAFKDEYIYYDPVTGAPIRQVNYDYKESIGNWGLGFTLGYQKTLWQVIYLDAFIGGGIQFSDRTSSGLTPDDSYDYYSGIMDPAYKGILPKIGIHIGIGL